MIWLLAAACAVATVPAGLRWLRVAQREHYLPGEVTRFAWRWWHVDWVNWTLDVVATLAVVLSIFDLRWGFIVAAAQVGPLGLSIRGVTSPIAWTKRLRRVAITTGMLALIFYLLGALFGQPFVIVLPLYLLYAIVDFSLWVLGPFEKRRGDEWVEKAAQKLQAVNPVVVAITGSYGKTTTKNYLAHLIAGSMRVVASPASFNNRMGLARAINENLAPGTEVFIAEMGTYGYGEIAELCEWIPPKVGAMVSIGPVHLERFGTLDDIANAKSEILDRAEIGVICVDYPQLARVADERREHLEIVEVSGSDVDAPPGVFPVNLAVALAIGEVLGVERSEMMTRVDGLSGTDHRQSVLTSESGFTIVDDTFNSNPDGARSALDKLIEVGDGGRTAVVTPGMVELGERQDLENERFAALAAGRVDDLVIVGRTNRKALSRGSANGKASVTVVGSREEAVAWARANLGPGDAVLYENDLPDHYP